MIEYQFGDKVYEQRPLVLGQYRQLMELLKDISFPEEFGIGDLLVVIGDKISDALSIVLLEKGTSLRTRNTKELAEELDYILSPDQVFKVVEDFFVCNDLESTLKKLGEMSKTITQKLNKTPVEDM